MIHVLPSIATRWPPVTSWLTNPTVVATVAAGVALCGEATVSLP